MDKITNRVAQSTLISLDLEEYYHKGHRVIYDLKQNLWQELILKEKDFRAFIKEYDWSQFQDCNVALICSADAIIPTWAYMLLVSKIAPYANLVIVGNELALEQALFQQALSKIDFTQYNQSKVVVKGCGKFPVPSFAYGEITRLLLPYAASIMYGEPCSTVPVYKIPVASSI